MLPGRAVLVAPIKPTLKVNYDILLSNFAFKLDLRRFSQVGERRRAAASRPSRAAQVATIKTRVESAICIGV